MHKKPKRSENQMCDETQEVVFVMVTMATDINHAFP